MKNNTSTTYQVQWYDAIAKIAEQDWFACFKDRAPVCSYEYNHALEIAMGASTKFSYLVVRKQAQVIAITACFEYEFAIDTITTGLIKKVILSLRKYYPRFMIVRSLFAGHLTSVGDNLWGINYDEVGEDDEAEVLLLIAQKVKEQSKRRSALFTVFKEFSKEDKRRYELPLKSELLFANSIPSAELTLKPRAAYIDQIKSKYKSILKARKKRFNSYGLACDIIYDAEPYKKEIYRMYSDLLVEAEVKFEFLNEDYFVNILKKVPGAFLVIVKQDQKVVGFSLNIEGEEAVYGLYLGYDNEVKDSNIYFNLFYKVIHEAITRKKNKVFLGQTSYEVKAGLGATFNDLYIGIHSSNFLLNILIRRLKDVLFPKTKIAERNVWN